MYIIQLLDWYAASISVIAICFVELVMVAWLYGVDNFARDVGFMTGHRPGWWWRCCWRYITPAILGALFVTTLAFNAGVQYAGRAYPMWALVCGWWTAIASLLCIPLYAVWRVLWADAATWRLRWWRAARVHGMRPARQPYRAEYEKLVLNATTDAAQQTPVAVVWRPAAKVGAFSEHML